MSELRPPAPPKRHLLSIRDLDRDDVERILDRARSLAASLDREVKKLPTLRGRTVVNLFYESSTRTLASFELAAKRLSADTMSIRSAGSSVDKGESLKDTALTLAAYEPDVIVVRHPSIGAPKLVDAAHGRPRRERRRREAPASDAGTARPVHDPRGARAARRRPRRDRGRRAPLPGRPLARPGAPARRCGSRRWSARRRSCPGAIESLGCEVSHDLDATIDADVVYVLRMQRERMTDAFVPSLREYTTLYGITPERVREGQLVMHPGPMNRGIEIDPRVADSEAALVTDQVRAGLVVRMAVLYDVLTAAPATVPMPDRAEVA